MKLAMMQTTPIFSTFSAHTKMAADKRGQIKVFGRNIIIIPFSKWKLLALFGIQDDQISDSKPASTEDSWKLKQGTEGNNKSQLKEDWLRKPRTENYPPKLFQVIIKLPSKRKHENRHEKELENHIESMHSEHVLVLFVSTCPCYKFLV